MARSQRGEGRKAGNQAGEGAGWSIQMTSLPTQSTGPPGPAESRKDILKPHWLVSQPIREEPGRPWYPKVWLLGLRMWGPVGHGTEDGLGGCVPYLGQFLFCCLFNVVAERQLGIGDGTVVPGPFLERETSMSSPLHLRRINFGTQGSRPASPQHLQGMNLSHFRRRVWWFHGIPPPSGRFLIKHLFWGSFGIFRTFF